jgi:hypothetical protein|uniref:DUF456 domain-containing protein n=1 Tax=uncultured haloarchaeon TaxID=160804 RepID=A5YSZ3_9EURY|nr:hypothetical protein [uncultured haloarchaeon]
MSKERQEQRTNTTSQNDGGRLSESGSTVSSKPVSNRTSWSGLLKRTYNVLNSKSGSTRATDSSSSAVLGGLMFVGALIAGAIPLPLSWIAGVGIGSIVGKKTGNGSPILATGVGALIGLVFGLTFAPSFFGLGIILTLLLTVVSAVVGGVGFLVLEE